MNELINIDAINDYITKSNWTSYKFYKELNLDYSYVYRVLKKEVNGGNKFIFLTTLSSTDNRTI